jgi:hypothetical protein
MNGSCCFCSKFETSLADTCSLRGTTPWSPLTNQAAFQTLRSLHIATFVFSLSARGGTSWNTNQTVRFSWKLKATCWDLWWHWLLLVTSWHQFIPNLSLLNWFRSSPTCPSSDTVNGGACIICARNAWCPFRARRQHTGTHNPAFSYPGCSCHATAWKPATHRICRHASTVAPGRLD